MDSFVGSEEQQRQQIQRLLSLTDSAMGGDEEIYTDQNGVQIVFNPMNLDSPRPMPVNFGFISHLQTERNMSF